MEQTINIQEIRENPEAFNLGRRERSAEPMAKAASKIAALQRGINADIQSDADFLGLGFEDAANAPQMASKIADRVDEQEQLARDAGIEL